MDLPVMPPFTQKCCSHFNVLNQLDMCDMKMNTPLRAHQISLSNVRLRLHNEELWKQFYKETTEMIITKAGRRMFPHLQVNINGLQENVNYCVLVEMEPVSQNRHKYCGSNTIDENQNKNSSSGGWTKSGQAESQPDIEHRIYLHPESPARGAHWMKHVVNFNKLKVTNNADHGSNVLLTSMHKYIPRIWVFQSDRIGNFNQLCSKPCSSFTFKETEFIAVTAYQNEKITELKINNNPFAKGFRDPENSRSKRRHGREGAGHSSQMSDESESNSSFETNPLPHRGTTMLLRTGVLHNIANTDAVDGVKLSPMVPVQDLTSRAENNHLIARPSSPRRKLHRPWVDSRQSPPFEFHLLPPPLPLLSTLPDLSLYNYQFPTPDLLPHSFALPMSSQYYHSAYPNMYDWHETLYHMTWYPTMY